MAKSDVAVTEARTPANLHTWSTDDLRAELSRSLEITAKHLAHLAAIWRELEYRGENLSSLRSGLWVYMPAIAAGRLRPELVVQYAGHSMLLRQLANLVPEDQDKLLRDPVVLVVEREGPEWIERHIPLTQLRAAQIRQVLSDHIRAPNEQRRIAATIARTREHARPTTRSTLAETGLAERAAALAIDEPRRGRERRSAALPVSLAPAERSAIEERAKAAGVSASALVRAALRVAGLLPAEAE